VATVLVGRLDAPTNEETGTGERAWRRIRPGAPADPHAVGALAARAARAGGAGAAAAGGALARPDGDGSDPASEVLAAGKDAHRGRAACSDDEAVEIGLAGRRRFGLPPAGAVLGIVALSFATLVPTAEASFLGSSANDHNRFATATASFAAEATITLDLVVVYCAEVTVTTDWPSPTTWEVTLDLSTAPLNGTPYQAADAQIGFTDPVLTATGSASNATVSASAPTTWTFCANRLGGGAPQPPTMVLPELDGGGTTAEPAPGPGDTATYRFSFTYPQDIDLDGIMTADLRVERDAPGNSPGQVGVTVLAEETPIAAGTSDAIRAEGWLQVSFALDDLGPSSGTFPAGTAFHVDVELRRVRMELGGASQIVLPPTD
jgi:hypothetical protein